MKRITGKLKKIIPTMLSGMHGLERNIRAQSNKARLNIYARNHGISVEQARFELAGKQRTRMAKDITFNENLSVEQMNERLKKLGKNVLPGKITETYLRVMGRISELTHHIELKEKAVNSAFGKNGRYGLIIVKPEMMDKLNEVRNFLKTYNYNIVLESEQRLSPAQLATVWKEPIKGHRKGEPKRIDYSHTGGIHMRSENAMVVVFELPKKEIAEARKRGVPPQAIFSEKRKGPYSGEQEETLRTTFKPRLKEIGIESGKQLTGYAKKMDSLGYLNEKVGTQGDNPLFHLSLVHIPEGKTEIDKETGKSKTPEILNDASGLLTLNQINKIRKRKVRMRLRRNK
ncbi:MAG: hypothetical protein JW703_03440 [Candidatus Diapherotrites archaeon]|nr:hypothetical protein [Candidatus Diapherotrites archaeon]